MRIVKIFKSSDDRMQRSQKHVFSGHFVFCFKLFFSVDRDTVVGIATRYGLDRIPVGARFSLPVQNGSRAHPASYTVDTGSLSGG